MKTFIDLFISFFKIGVFGYGGGYAMLPLIEREVVINNPWLTSSQFLDIIGISQMTPGPISINTATFVGYQIGGFFGSVAATVGVVSFSFMLVSIATHYILKFKNSKVLKNALMGMRPALIGLIISAFISLAGKSYLDFKSIIIGVIILGVSLKSKLHPILVIVLSGVLGTVFYGIL
ncbi:chromate transporter [Alkaliphilus oremlandii]|uniref:Chromate transporter n=1 Tax=Alkaliphilus oremlandii (strain OhILAs) TaxID=350688 RepID=A8MG34_ALKOO|nr:chromate transporter [Alkaliphilus oremlandii]ABW18572.1 Chromate transporter [Alkaliphilus oremlandii OhILAs]